VVEACLEQILVKSLHVRFRTAFKLIVIRRVSAKNKLKHCARAVLDIHTSVKFVAKESLTSPILISLATTHHLATRHRTRQILKSASGMLSRCPTRVLRAFTASVQPKQGYARHPGDPNKIPYEKIVPKLDKWRKHWTMGMKRKIEIEGKPEPTARRNIGQWDEVAELNCFKKRLGIEMENDLLEAVFAVDPSQSLLFSSPKTHTELCSLGEDFTYRFLQHYTSISLSDAPEDCQQSVIDYLRDPSTLSHLAAHLGYDDLVRSPIYPIPEGILADVFHASIGAISLQHPVVAGRFLIDFLIPQLVGKDILHDIWKPTDPMSLLVEELKARSMSAPEARLISQTGINTVMPMFVVGLYSGRDFLANSGAESVALAEVDAAKIVLRKFYRLEECGKTLMMGRRVTEDFVTKLYKGLLAEDGDLKVALSG